MNGEERYGCQVKLPGFGADAQAKLQVAKVLVIGAGGLGCPAAQYLAAAGIGHLAIADGDTISVSNLHRQILYTPADAGRNKAQVACEKLHQQNPSLTLVAIQENIAFNNAIDIIGSYDVIVDCTDNFDARYLINDAAVILGKPVVYAAIYQYEGQVAVWNAQGPKGPSPNYRDVFPEVNSAAIPDCTDGGVFPMLAGVIGCMQAGEVIKLITGAGEHLAGKLLTLDMRTMESYTIGTGDVTKVEIKKLVPSCTIPSATLDEITDNKDGFCLIDVRTAEERRIKNIGGVHIPLADIDKLDALPSPKPIVCYCASGKRSKIAAGILRRKFPQAIIYTLEGGI